MTIQVVDLFGRISPALEALVTQRSDQFLLMQRTLEETATVHLVAGATRGDIAAAHAVLTRAPIGPGESSGQPRFRVMLTEQQHKAWRDRLRDLAQLLSESGAFKLEALVYASDDTLICELGPPGRTLALAVDDEGVSLSFRQRAEDFGSYLIRSWASLPPLHEFMQLLSEYSGQKRYRRAWMHPISPKSYHRMSLSDAAFATTQAIPSSSNATEAFASL